VTLSNRPACGDDSQPDHRTFGSRPASILRNLALIAVLTCQAANAGDEISNKQIFGWVESAVVSNERVEMKAKLDTGAMTSSLHAVNIHRFRRDGTHMVRFDIEDPASGHRVTLERPLARKVRIKESDTGEYSRRPVVELWLCIGDIGRNVEVNLVDRSHFIYPLLVGRNFLSGLILVDSDETFTRSPACDAADLKP
jgi:hypothetical protein